MKWSEVAEAGEVSIPTKEGAAYVKTVPQQEVMLDSYIHSMNYVLHKV